MIRHSQLFVAFISLSSCVIASSLLFAQDGTVSPISAERVTNLSDLKEYARSVSELPYQEQPPLVPKLAELSYEQYREIQFRHKAAIWDDGEHPFWLEFFHRGFIQRDRVDVYLIEPDEQADTIGSKSSRVEYSPKQFDLGEINSDLEVPDGVGYAGLKIAGRFVPKGDAQELLTFIGSSYFRSRTGKTVYGTSSRGLAVNIAMNQDEEFPDFQTFWVQKPEKDDTDVLVLAFMDSPSLTGAYRFEFTPGETVTEMIVDATLYFRNAPDKLAFAPLTSMWIWGDGLDGPPKDNRPSVHDSDGLLIHADDRWQWRPFARLPYPSVSGIAVDSLGGFGLLQRDREFQHFLDTGARYHERPSVWIEPLESFGKGRVELLEIPGAHEGIDNIGAYFISDQYQKTDQPIDLKYRVTFFGKESDLGDRILPERKNGRQLATCRSLDVSRDEANSQITLSLFFENPEERESVSDGKTTVETVRPAIQTIRGEVIEQTTKPATGGYTCQIVLSPTEPAPIEIELTLEDADGQELSETFRYLCPHEKPRFVIPAVYTRQE